MELRVATFNVHHGVGRDGVLDLERTAAIIRSTGADLVALQELDRGLARSGSTDQPAMLQELTGYEIAYFPTLKFGSGDYGIAVAAREPLAAEFEQLPQAASEESRGAIRARWRQTSLIAAHLAKQPGARGFQMQRLASLVAEAPPPAVVAGDLNAPLRALGPLLEAGLNPARVRTASLLAPLRRQIDYVLAGPGLSIQRARTIRSPASDHLPVIADLVGE